MKKVFSPIALLAFVVLPQLLSISYWSISIEGSNIESRIFPLIVISFSCLYFAVYGYTKRKEEAISSKMFLVISVIYACFILFGAVNRVEAFYRDGFTSPMLIFIMTNMVSVLYGIIGFCKSTTLHGKDYKVSKYTLGLLLVPLIWFLVGTVLGGMNSNTVVMTLIIASVYTLIFLVTKILFIWGLNKAPLAEDNQPSKKYYTAALIMALIMPLLGLAINQGSGGGWSSAGISSGVFGDFGHPIFFIIAALNGALLLVPKVTDSRLRLFLFYLKAAGYTYILYFFIVFLPIMPVGIIGIAFGGLGLLIFAPAMVTILQGYHLIKEGTILRKSWGLAKVLVVFFIGIITIPLCLGITVYGDKANFKDAIEYLQTNDADELKPVNLTRLKRTLKNIKGDLLFVSGRFDFSETNTPIISNVYSSYVLDEKIISKENVIGLENLFFDKGHNVTELTLSDPSFVSNNVSILEAASSTSFDEKSGVYKSWVNLKLKNNSTDGNGEYKTEFKLPEGAYITDYYLDVLGKRKEGILTDRRAALFMYQKIVNTRRDPGLLHYIGKSTLELRVFPFMSNEVRETGFEIIHSKKFTLELEGKAIPLGGDDKQKEIKVSGAVLLTAEQKAILKSAIRKPKYYFVIDSSENSDVEWNLSQVKEYAKLNNITTANVIFASHKLLKSTLSELSTVKYTAQCGFNLNMAVRDILSKEDKNAFPIIIAVSDNMPSAVMPYEAYTLSKSFPESSYYYALNHNLSLKPYSFEDNKSGSSTDKPIVAPVLDYNGVLVLNNGENEVILTNELEETFVSTRNQYDDAVLINALIASGNTDSIDLLRASFRGRILTPQNAFIVVETQEQEKDLLALQEKLLSNNEATPTVTLDEPSLVSCVIILLVVVFIVKRKRLKKVN
jgi:hypothetical protein